MNKDRARTPANIAGTKRLPLAPRKTCHWRGNDREVSWRYCAARRYTRNGTTTGSQTQAIKVTKRGNERLLWNIPLIIKRLFETKHQARPRRVRIIKPSQCTLELALGQLLNSLLGKSALRTEKLNLF